jgi:hypothetical protein
VVGLVGNKGPWRLHGQIDQRLIGRAVRRFARRSQAPFMASNHDPSSVWVGPG